MAVYKWISLQPLEKQFCHKKYEKIISFKCWGKHFVNKFTPLQLIFFRRVLIMLYKMHQVWKYYRKTCEVKKKGENFGSLEKVAFTKLFTVILSISLNKVLFLLHIFRFRLAILLSSAINLNEIFSTYAFISLLAGALHSACCCIRKRLVSGNLDGLRMGELRIGCKWWCVWYKTAKCWVVCVTGDVCACVSDIFNGTIACDDSAGVIGPDWNGGGGEDGVDRRLCWSSWWCEDLNDGGSRDSSIVTCWA